MHPSLILVGAPNSGKTTLYNWLTNSRYRAVNYPGSTVEISKGKMAPRMNAEFEVIDTPGTYSLNPKSLDEEVTVKVLKDSLKNPSLTLVVIDGTQMARHLLLAQQIKQQGLPFMIVVTMGDMLKKKGFQLNPSALEKEFGAPVVIFDGVLGEGLLEIPKSAQAAIQKALRASINDLKAVADSDWHEALRIEREFLGGSKNDPAVFMAGSLAADRWILHPVLGLLLFFAVMTALFTGIYTFAAPLMDFVDGFFAGLAGATVALGPESLFFQFLGEGVLAGFGAVLVFVPQIFILFLGIGILESSGYLARASTLIDRPFSALGLSGRSFVPLLSGFACAVPALMATRNLSSPRDRWITQFIIPLMTCSARLPVYALLLGFLFAGESAWKAGLALAALYFFAVVLGALASGILNKLLKKAAPSHLMMELPIYRWPQWRVLFRHSFDKTLSYVKRAGPMILVFSILIWAGTRFPGPEIENSYLAATGRVLDPVMEPMGADWRVGVGLLSAFAAREVFVSTMAVLFQVTAEDEEGQTTGLMEAMRQATHADGSLLFTPALAVALLVFFAIALQCMSTFVMAIKESGSRNFAIVQLVTLNVVAYVLAVLTYQLLA